MSRPSYTVVARYVPRDARWTIEGVDLPAGYELLSHVYRDQLGTEQESAEGVQFGTIDMYMGSSGAVGRFLPSLEAFSAPFVWRDVDHMMKVVRGPIGYVAGYR